MSSWHAQYIYIYILLGYSFGSAVHMNTLFQNLLSTATKDNVTTWQHWLWLMLLFDDCVCALRTAHLNNLFFFVLLSSYFSPNVLHPSYSSSGFHWTIKCLKTFHGIVFLKGLRIKFLFFLTNWNGGMATHYISSTWRLWSKGNLKDDGKICFWNELSGMFSARYILLSTIRHSMSGLEAALIKTVPHVTDSPPWNICGITWFQQRQTCVNWTLVSLPEQHGFPLHCLLFVV